MNSLVSMLKKVFESKIYNLLWYVIAILFVIHLFNYYLFQFYPLKWDSTLVNYICGSLIVIKLLEYIVRKYDDTKRA
jgi:hypothetical protein